MSLQIPIVVTRQRSKVERKTRLVQRNCTTVFAVYTTIQPPEALKKNCTQLTDSHGSTCNGAEQREEDREDIVKMMTVA